MRKLLQITAALLALIALTAALSACSARKYASMYDAVTDGAALPARVAILGLDVSSLPILEAREKLMALSSERAGEISFTVTAGGESFIIPASRIGLGYDIDAALLEALALGEPFLFSADKTLRTVQAASYADLAAIKRRALEAVAALEREARDATARYEEGRFRYTAEASGFAIDARALIASLEEAASGLSEASDDTKFEIAAVTSEIEPAYTLEEAKRDTALVSTFTTSFSGSTYSKKGRVANIKKAAELISGKTIEKGGSFSMNEALGARNEENGWSIAIGIRDGAYIEEYGGGVCQVSTTLYNAALMADMTIVERSHHSWPLGYIDIGRDATISTNGPDLVLRNDSEAAVFIISRVDTEKKTVTVELYGRELADGVTIELRSKKVATLDDLGTSYTVIDTLPPGTANTVREARQGSLAETYKRYISASGELIGEELVTRDKYRSIKGLVELSPDMAGVVEKASGDISE